MAGTVAFQNRHASVPDDIAIIIPTLNAAEHRERQVEALARQGYPAECFLVIDSSSTDGTAEFYAAHGIAVHRIESKDFNHGGTRRLAVGLRPKAAFIVMMTQDAIPDQDASLAAILAGFKEADVGLSYGRQLHRSEARGIERHARLMNYPPASNTRSLADAERLGVKVTFCSNSFAAYRRTALEGVGNFPQDSYFAEDQVVAGKMLQNGWRIAYRADATVIHSHGYTIAEDFRRYFDVGVFHSRNRWMLEAYGTAEGEGLRFILSELKYLLRHDPVRIPSALLRTPAKYLAYRLGQREARLSPQAKRRLSMQPFYWK